VASRIANSLRAGYPVRTADELNNAPAILVHAPSEQLETLLAILENAEIEWRSRPIIFCDCSVGREVRQRLQSKGASVAVVREFGIQGRMVIEAEKGRQGISAAALRTAHRIVRQLHVKTVEIPPACSDVFDAAVILGSGALTPLIDHSASLLRAAGIRDIEAARIALSLFEQTARDYAHSGRQSWIWHVRKPEAARLRSQIAAAGPNLQSLLRELLLSGFERFSKHPDVAADLAAGRE
jgi:hypothetical protein